MLIFATSIGLQEVVFEWLSKPQHENDFCTVCLTVSDLFQP